MGGLRVGGGLVVSGSLAGAGAASLEPGPAAAVGVGVEAGVVMGLIVECSVNSSVEAVNDLGADLLAQFRWYDGAGDVVLVGAGLAGLLDDGAVWVALVDGLVGGVPGQHLGGLIAGQGPSGGVLEPVVGLTEYHEVVQASGPDYEIGRASCRERV